ncbi:hypothetical protein A2W14_07105 [Candidatus Gottesmanbacteria bacterium RBG_16_37_8]|uniref:Uncharacterized protein n=1 Tax=Candidatus Gottesmanbacteria bacterium RBG_16_37_8 TaxID=1798371 RepID=A0A1F5YVY2_9BACT|nr:MAG: hypothetical protein A2W14_07105 [Candidatus Gottesmanbacteria bacterium RBG_16_37_8]
MLRPIALYLSIGLLSIISAVFVIKTIPLETIHIQKAMLHLFRRLEYFSLFFIFYASIRNLRQIKAYLLVLIGTIVLVSLYGFGQKYLYWPAFSTMNREFAKGWQLYLTEHARVLSTFGGHYDLAAFIMMAEVLLWSIFFALRKIYLKILLFAVIAMAFWTLILTASRTSFIAYLLGLMLMFFFWAYKKGIFWSVSRFFLVSFLSIAVMLSFGDLSERFTKFLKIDQRLSGIKMLLTSPIGKPPKDKAFFLENNPDALSEITSKSDQPPKLVRPSDVYQDLPLMINKDGTLSAVARTYSQTAYRYDLSTAIRLDALWPQAIRAFMRNPLLGSGYSTLNKAQLTDFTEAESTDNDFLRSLGETGILGFLAFYGTLFFILYYLWKNLEIMKDPILFSLSAGFAGLLGGLLVNAVYIDVFESSKVAFSFWALTGISLASVRILKEQNRQPVPKPRIADIEKALRFVKLRLTSFVKSDLFFLLLISILAFSLRYYKINTPLADWHSWRQADTASVTRNFVKNGVNILFPTFDDLSNVASGKDNPKGLRFVEFPLFNLFHFLLDQFLVGLTLESKGRLTSIFSSIGTLIFLYLLVRKYSGRLQAILTSFFFAVLPFNIFFSRTILPEPFLVFTSTGMIYFFDKFLEIKDKLKKLVKLSLFLAFAVSSLLSKPYAAFLFPVLSYLWFRNSGFNIKSVIKLAFLLIFISLPFIAWRWWASHFPEGIPANLWLLNGDGIRFKGAFFFWLFADRLGRLILGFYGLPLLILGILAKKGKEGSLYVFWGLSILLYVTVFATGNVRHDYYQVLTIPIITIFLGQGAVFMIDLSRKFISAVKTYAVLIILIIFMEMFGWYYIRDFYNINHPEIVEAGQAVELKTPRNALVIAPYNGDTAFLYQTRRSGWPVMEKSIEDMIKMGAHYYVSVNFDDLTKKLYSEATVEDPEKRKYKLIEATAKYVVIQLVPDNKLPR